jgi:type I restriction enzyme M protein
VSLYGDSAHGIDDERVKVLPNEAFGFQRVTVERPLRLRWEVSDDTIAAVMATKALPKLEEETQAVLEETLRRHIGASAPTAAELGGVLAPTARTVWSERDWTVESDDPEDFASSLWIENSEAKAILTALAVRDDEAPIITKRNGQPEADPDRRDAENVPLPLGTPVWDQHDEGAEKRLADAVHRAAVDAYMEAEVLPWVPDAWVDWTKTKIGYEIPLTRHFYKYVPPRPLTEIDAEIKSLEMEIQGLLAEVTDD